MTLALRRAVPYNLYMATKLSNVGQVRGQMTVDECIDIATTGRDGKPVVPAHEPTKPKPTRSSVIAGAVAERLRKESK